MTDANQDDVYLLEYKLSDETRIFLRFSDINDRDGCHISLDMYKAQLGPVTEEVLHRILKKFSGEVVTS